MLSEIIDPRAESPRSKLFWAVIAALALGILGAFYTVCMDQVRKSQAREAGYKMQRLAITDCLQHRADATIGSCFRQAGAQHLSDQADGLVNAVHRTDAGHAVMASPVPVNYAFR